MTATLLEEPPEPCRRCSRDICECCFHGIAPNGACFGCNRPATPKVMPYTTFREFIARLVP